MGEDRVADNGRQYPALPEFPADPEECCDVPKNVSENLSEILVQISRQSHCHYLTSREQPKPVPPARLNIHEGEPCMFQKR